jgi:branched-chain amino acid transport system ATP-binding protein
MRLVRRGWREAQWTTDMTTPMLRIEGLRAGYGRAEVLHGLDLQAAPGSVITVIGPNGAGKSTLLNTLMGVIPSHGTLQFDGQDIGILPLEERVMLGMALVPERRELFGSMPVEDNLVLGAYRQVRLGNRQWRDRLEDVYTIFPRLKERRMQLAGTLSGGERQMLAVGRALMSRPRLLMLDEPTTGLAPVVAQAAFEALEGLKKKGMTLLIAEQQVPLALSVADRGYVLENGRIRLEGGPEELAQNPEVRRAYLGVA